jgi:hypothetical protein
MLKTFGIFALKVMLVMVVMGFLRNNIAAVDTALQKVGI